MVLRGYPVSLENKCKLSIYKIFKDEVKDAFDYLAGRWSLFY